MTSLLTSSGGSSEASSVSGFKSTLTVVPHKLFLNIRGNSRLLGLCSKVPYSYQTSFAQWKTWSTFSQWNMGDTNHSNVNVQFRAPARAVIARGRYLAPGIPNLEWKPTEFWECCHLCVPKCLCFWSMNLFITWFYRHVHVAVPFLWTRDGCGFSLWV